MKKIINSLSTDNKISPLKRGLVLLLPYFCLVICIALTCVLFLMHLEGNNPLYRMIVNGNFAVNEDEYKAELILTDEFKTPYFGECWAILNVEDWENKDIPVFYGDTNRILIKGAGMWNGSRFCGQNGKTVLSAHVTKHFREIQDTKIGTVVTMQTGYGLYKYEVIDKKIFSANDDSLLLADDGNETLVMYTCYPFESRIRKQRIALICRKIEGKVFDEN